jgi:hypothetical protein
MRTDDPRHARQGRGPKIQVKSQRRPPFTYLGLPLCVTQQTVQDCWPLVQRIEVRLTKHIYLLNLGRQPGNEKLYSLINANFLHVFN